MALQLNLTPRAVPARTSLALSFDKMALGKGSPLSIFNTPGLTPPRTPRGSPNDTARGVFMPLQPTTEWCGDLVRAAPTPPRRRCATPVAPTRPRKDDRRARVGDCGADQLGLWGEMVRLNFPNRASA